MNIYRLFLAIAVLPLLLISCTGSSSNENTLISVKTTLGDFKIKLYDETPLHRDNFIHLVNNAYYEGISFHRIIKGFMVQTGDYSTRKDSNPLKTDSISNQTIPSEFVPGLYHKRGAVAAARQDNSINPEMRSSATQFYIVQGSKMNEYEFSLQEQQRDNNIRQAEFIKIFLRMADSCKKAGLSLSQGEIQENAILRMDAMPDKATAFKTTETERNTYLTSGGVPPLDGTYTVFGEIVEGMEIIDRIASVNTTPEDSPVEDIRIIKMKIVKK